ncbi:hypothetical protein [Sediminibacterium soli]|uniref:hypothetical protein n=1 Tax=Sediminibacterium soli TaxID=2698829 RepID=UPI00137ABD25|nr:hypothetical protein [Sediminibacterium soli]NCI47954.1 hypothetical protein [Sediminibacterium soli]
MKRMLPYLLVIPVLLFASCKKGVWVPDRSFGVTDVTGNWYIAEAAQNSGSGWSYINTGLERGTFSFYGNGAARYEDNYNVMTGNWDIMTLSDGYYDRYGDYHQDVHQAFRVRVYDSYTNNSVDLYFDNIVSTGNSLVATSYNGRTITRYIFDRDY